MESIESSTQNLTLSPLSALNLPADSAKFSSAKKLQKISSADSLFTMIKNLASNRSVLSGNNCLARAMLKKK
jgi:hypothetical protein